MDTLTKDPSGWDVDELEYAARYSAMQVAAPLMLTGGTDVDVRELTLDEMSDVQLLDCMAAVEDQHQQYSANFRAMEGFYKAEIGRRLAERKARALLHPRYKTIEIEESFGKYDYDIVVCKQIKELLKANGKDDEAAKVIKTYEGFVEACGTCKGTGAVEVATRDEVGASGTFTWLIERYGEHPELGPLLKRVRTRPSLGATLKIVRKVGA